MNRAKRRQLNKQQKKRGSAIRGGTSADIEHLFEKAIFHHQAGRLADAERIYRRIVEAQPNLAMAHYNMGVAIDDQGRTGDAVTCYRRTIDIDPNYIDAYNNLGNAYETLGRLEEAVAVYRRALAISPNFFKAHNNLGNALEQLGDIPAAIESFKRALRIKPDYAEAKVNIGNLLKIDRRNDEAIAYYEEAISDKPTLAAAHINLGDAMKDQGRLDEADVHYERAIELDGSNVGYQIKRLLSFSPIVASKEEITRRRQTIHDGVRGISTNGKTMDSPYKSVRSTNFHLAYQGLPNRDLQHDIAQMYLSLAPTLSWQPQERNSARSNPGKLRIGFISALFFDHTIGHLNRGIVENLDRERFEVIVFQISEKKDDIAAAFKRAADKVVPLIKELESARRLISAENIDLLYYTDIGMDDFTYFLAFSRLAPVQTVTWGHPDTSGIPNIDYFISSVGLEPLGAECHYTEQLIRLRNMPVYHHTPAPHASVSVRKLTNLPSDAKIYLCPQSLFKFHPDFDPILGEILNNDPNGVLVLVSGRHETLNDTLLERFQRKFPDEANRIIFVPRMTRAEYANMLTVADALLDTPGFSGGYSSFVAFTLGVPIVTMESEFMRGRVTIAFYKEMKINDLIADNPKAYAGIAFRLANDHAFRETMEGKIQEQRHLLYENIDAVRELERFFEAAVAAADAGNLLPTWNG